LKRALLAQPPQSDAELVVLVAQGNLEALGELFDRYQALVRQFVARLGVNIGDLDDLTQSTFLEVIPAAPRFNIALPVKNWLFGLAVILVRRHRRSLSRAAARLLTWGRLTFPEASPSPAADFDRGEDLRRFQAALNRLSPKKLEVFTLVTLEGFSGEAVARILDIPVTTVRTRLHHARLELRASVEEGEL
jgi:RNA polymerase sigma-70 factor, ECF subfamily